METCGQVRVEIVPTQWELFFVRHSWRTLGGFSASSEVALELLFEKINEIYVEYILCLAWASSVNAHTHNFMEFNGKIRKGLAWITSLLQCTKKIYKPQSSSRDSTENVQNQNGGKIIYFEYQQYQRRENNVDTAWASLTQMQHFFIRHDNGRNRFAVVWVNEEKIPIFRWVFDRISILLNFRRKCRKICQQNTADRD